MPFARFMELALYCPVCGYYEKEKDTIGRRGDYYTSVSVGSAFGELLASQFAAWLEEFPVSSARSGVSGFEGQAAGQRGGGDRRFPLQIVEAGAHSGQLAKDILTWLRAQRPELYERLEYGIVEPSPRRREWQQRTLAEFTGKVLWFNQPSELAGPAPGARDVGNTGGVCGVIFANELLDALPVHRLGWDAHQQVWFEWGVTLQEGRFAWTRMPLPIAYAFPLGAGAQPVSDLGRGLPDGFTLDTRPAATAWWRAAAAALVWGRLVSIDYGLEAEEFFLPQRKEGTLRAYYRHRLCSDVLAHPGEQDLTAHVNFTALRAVGEAGGLKTEAFLTQGQFLTHIAARFWQDETSSNLWSPARTRQFRTLTHPELLGEKFRVLVQSRGAPPAS